MYVQLNGRLRAIEINESITLKKTLLKLSSKYIVQYYYYKPFSCNVNCSLAKEYILNKLSVHEINSLFGFSLIVIIFIKTYIP